MLASRESSGVFYDVRALLCRMTSHLAWADGQGRAGPPGPTRALVEALLSTWMGNQADALVRLERIELRPETLLWVRALRARNTGDYRELAVGEDLTPIEQVCLFEARARSFDPLAAGEAAPPAEVRRPPDYCRIANALPHSVQLGHVLSSLSLALEQAELRRVWAMVQGANAEEKLEFAALNADPEYGVSFGSQGADQPQVIGWGTWAMFAQRQFCHTVLQTRRFLKYSWGVPALAAEFTPQAEALFGPLKPYDVVRMQQGTHEDEYHAAADASVQLQRAKPHQLGPSVWNLFYEPPPGLSLYQTPDLLDVSAWHKHSPPPFTACHFKPRLNPMSLSHRPEDGVLIDGENERTKAAGLKKGRILVGLEGRRVHNFNQYLYLRSRLTGPALHLTVWDGRGYVEVAAQLPGRRFDVPFRTYSRGG